MMMPPNGACLSVANAFSHASRRVGIAPHAAGIGVLQNRHRRFREFLDQIGRRGDVEEVVKGKLLAVQFFEMVRKVP